MKNLPKMLTLLLATSLLLNFAMGAFILTQKVRSSIAASLTQSAFAEYPPEFVDAYRSALRSDWRLLLEKAKKLEAARSQQHQIITAEKFDRAAFEEAQVELRAAQVALILTLQDPLVDAVETLPDEVRRNLPQIRLRPPVNGVAPEESAE